MKKLDILVAVLLIVGGLNWGLVGAFQFDLVQALFGDIEMFPTILYISVGLAAVYQLYTNATQRQNESTNNN